MILFCLPYAGASSVSIYSRWKRYMPSIDVVPIELAGRGRRTSEEFYDNINEATKDIIKLLKLNNIDNQTYAIFGHSMGATLAYEVYKMLKLAKIKKPDHVFFSGWWPPKFNIEYDAIDNMSNEEIIDNFFDETSKIFVKTPEFQNIFLPILKSDIQLLNNYTFYPDIKVECTVTFLNGTKEKLMKNRQGFFEMVCANKVNSYIIEGNHFFLNTNMNEILKIIKKELRIERKI